VGGGFGKGIHNTLEAAVYGKPVFFGPHYKKFREASGLIRSGGGISVGSWEELSAAIKKLLADNSLLEQCSKNSFDFVQKNKGATGRILHYMEANRLLTS
jgi:3-deoxy-D-manno-octulosonic-acid transferase